MAAFFYYGNNFIVKRADKYKKPACAEFSLCIGLNRRPSNAACAVCVFGDCPTIAGHSNKTTRPYIHIYIYMAVSHLFGCLQL